MNRRRAHAAFDKHDDNSKVAGISSALLQYLTGQFNEINRRFDGVYKLLVSILLAGLVAAASIIAILLTR